ncbi:Uncharacterised protein g7281 [Pycnogonum litorale]
MGLQFGNLYKVRGVVYYKLSPFELKPLAGMITHGLPNMIRRIREEIFYVVPPFIAGYMILDWADKTHAQLQRKNPADYENDE